MAAEAVEGAGLDQPFERRLVDGLQIDALAEVEQVLERPALCPRPRDRLGGAAAAALDRRQAEDDLAVAHREVRFAGVDARRQHLDAEPAGVGDVLDHDVALVAVLDLAGQQRRHELRRVVGLEVGRLVGDVSVGGGMRLIESVTSEFHDQVEDLLAPSPRPTRVPAPLRRTPLRRWSMMSCFFLLIALMQA